jgi:hypothetical protein
MDKLPLEIETHLWGFVDVANTLRARSVCKVWLRWIDNNTLLWKSHYRRYCANQENDAKYGYIRDNDVVNPLLLQILPECMLYKESVVERYKLIYIARTMIEYPHSALGTLVLCSLPTDKSEIEWYSKVKRGKPQINLAKITRDYIPMHVLKGYRDIESSPNVKSELLVIINDEPNYFAIWKFFVSHLVRILLPEKDPRVIRRTLQGGMIGACSLRVSDLIPKMLSERLTTRWFEHNVEMSQWKIRFDAIDILAKHTLKQQPPPPPPIESEIRIESAEPPANRDKLDRLIRKRKPLKTADGLTKTPLSTRLEPTRLQRRALKMDQAKEDKHVCEYYRSHFPINITLQKAAALFKPEYIPLIRSEDEYFAFEEDEAAVMIYSNGIIEVRGNITKQVAKEVWHCATLKVATYDAPKTKGQEDLDEEEENIEEEREDIPARRPKKYNYIKRLSHKIDTVKAAGVLDCMDQVTCTQNGITYTNNHIKFIKVKVPVGLRLLEAIICRRGKIEIRDADSLEQAKPEVEAIEAKLVSCLITNKRRKLNNNDDNNNNN